MQGLEVDNHIGRKIPLDLEFTDSTGKKATLARLFNRPTVPPVGGGSEPDTGAGLPTDLGRARPVLLMMMYFRCPLLCPKTLEELTTSLNQIDFTVGKDFDVLVVSFDPRDTPQGAAQKKFDALMNYDRVTTDSIRNSWNFLTGSVENSKALADSLGFPYRYQADVGEFAHRSVIFVLTPDGSISRYLPGLQSTMEFRSRDVRLALIEASQGRLGTWVDWFMGTCYHYDPNAGSYVMQAMAVMRLGAGGCAIVLSSVIGILFYNERRKRRARAADVPMSGAASNDGITSAAGGTAGVGAVVGGGGATVAGHAR